MTNKCSMAAFLVPKSTTELAPTMRSIVTCLWEVEALEEVTIPL